MQPRVKEDNSERAFAEAEMTLTTLDESHRDLTGARRHLLMAIKYREVIPVNERTTDDHAFLAKAYAKLSEFTAHKHLMKEASLVQHGIDAYAIVCRRTQQAFPYVKLAKLYTKLISLQLRIDDYAAALKTCQTYTRFISKETDLKGHDTLLRVAVELHWQVWEDLQETGLTNREDFITELMEAIIELATDFAEPTSTDCHFLGYVLLTALLSNAFGEPDNDANRPWFEIALNAFSAGIVVEEDKEDKHRKNALLYFLMSVCFAHLHDNERMSSAANQGILAWRKCKMRYDHDFAALANAALKDNAAYDVMPTCRKFLMENVTRLMRESKTWVEDYLVQTEKEAQRMGEKKRSPSFTLFQFGEEETLKRPKSSPPASPLRPPV